MTQPAAPERLLGQLRTARDTASKLVLLNRAFRVLQALQLEHQPHESVLSGDRSRRRSSIAPDDAVPESQSDQSDTPHIRFTRATPRASVSEDLREPGGETELMDAYHDGHVFDAVSVAELTADQAGLNELVLFCFNQRFAHSVLSSTTAYVLRDAGGSSGACIPGVPPH